MVRELYENAVRGIDTRQNLSALRSAVKDDAGMNDLFELVEDDLGTMTGFLDSDDPKVRKNAALLMGELICLILFSHLLTVTVKKPSFLCVQRT